MVGLHFAVPVVQVIPRPYTYLGVLPLLLGLWLNVVCSNTFGRARTTVKPFEPPSHLIVDGHYRYSRNPMYLGMVLVLVGVAVLFGTAMPAAVIPGFVWLMTRRFIEPEEKALEETFGEAYLAYRRAVRRWL